MTTSRAQFIRHTGIAAPYLQRDVEGEYIAPLGPELQDLQHLHMDRSHVVLEPHTHDGSYTGQHAFQGFRYRLDGSENPDFILNQAPYREASILLTGANFGLGSLQGFAVIRLMQCGMRVIISPSFGPVFHDDCFDYGLLPVTLNEQVIARLVNAVRADPEVQTTVDLERQVVDHPALAPISFRIDARRRVSLLTGVDNLEERLQHVDSAAAMRRRDQQARPWIYAPGGDRNR
jgi:3-isopropylmalate/(R)-2-methylmalate dehydratase small subunit